MNKFVPIFVIIIESHIRQKGGWMLNLAKREKLKMEFEELLLENMDSMYNLAYRMTLNTTDAADLVQDTSLRAFRFYHKFERGTNFKGWILTVLRNIFINQYRKRVKEPHKISYDEIENYIGGIDLKGYEEEIFSEHVQKSIDQLPDEMKTVITLFYVEDLSYKEVSEIMSCPIGTVMSRLHMARQMLKKKLIQSVKKEV